MPLISPDNIAGDYEVVVIGSGFGSLFFLQKHLQKKPPGRRVLVLEWGQVNTHAWQLENLKNSPVRDEDTFHRQPGEKPWTYTIGLGGGTNCWESQVPRFHPYDFKIHTTYGRGVDWPISYEDLEPYYLEAEHVMMVAGDEDIGAVYPRSGPFLQPPHRLSTPDEILKKAQPDKHFAFPMARLSQPHDGRSACCATARCPLCPVDAKWTALNGMQGVLQHPDLDIVLGARVTAIDHAAGVAQGVRFESGGKDRKVGADFVVLGANAIQSPHLLMRSGFDRYPIGRYLHEKTQVTVDVYLDGIDHFDGGSGVTGMNTSLLHGPHRKTHGGAFIRIENPWRYPLRTEYGRWRQVMPVSMLVPTEPLPENRVMLGADDQPEVHHPTVSKYGSDGIAWALEKLPEVLSPLPVEKIEYVGLADSAFHIQGTLRMGTDPKESVVDGDLLMHDVRNLMVVGTSLLPTCGSGNPSLTAAALSLRAADRLSA